ncbi:MAG TPA: hypothetical protein PKE20_13085 [Promineifilum sp.]|nr:hypothetical protein [Promineifilum sp.]
MGMQLLPALVARVDGVEKSHRVGHVGQHGQTQLTGRGPERVEAWVIDGHQPVVLVAHMQAERLPDLQSLRSPAGLFPQTPGGPLAEAVAVSRPLRPIDAAKDLEAIGSGSLEVVQMAPEHVFAPAAVEVHVGHNAGHVEGIEQGGKGLFVPAATERLGQVIMSVDDRIARPINRRLPGHQHCPGSKCFQFH